MGQSSFSQGANVPSAPAVDPIAVNRFAGQVLDTAMEDRQSYADTPIKTASKYTKMGAASQTPIQPTATTTGLTS